MTKSMQGNAAMQEWRRRYNPKKAEELEQETKRVLQRVSADKSASRRKVVSEPVFSM
ncbi:hypothetical protein [Vibrio parahaemolyticus]|uniref:hypothetical protein n=1 Tax=Vibrio parahaemolyticus TaxID=670 RepID=UPI0015D97517|nr:hypothetical protein [Vibrio parahaemolyticus]HCE4998729.1 hypothetical protein [Vibrio parahaemolyticus]